MASLRQIRDFRFLEPFVVEFGLYVWPVGFSSSVVPEQWRPLYSLNPMVGVIDGFRWSPAASDLYLPASSSALYRGPDAAVASALARRLPPDRANLRGSDLTQNVVPEQFHYWCLSSMQRNSLRISFSPSRQQKIRLMRCYFVMTARPMQQSRFSKMIGRVVHRASTEQRDTFCSSQCTPGQTEL